MRRGKPTQGAALTLIAVLAPASAAADDRATDIGGGEGELEAAARVEGHFGSTQPTARRPSWQRANTKLLAVQAGVGFGHQGPIEALRLTVEGGYIVSDDERVNQPHDVLPEGYRFYGEDDAGYVRATVRGDVVHTPRYALEVSLSGTAPIDVDLAKFSHVHIHYAAAEVGFRAHLTDPGALVRLDGMSRGFLGSGAYDGTYQHNPQLGLDALLALSFRRWLLPWRMTLAAGPAFLADLDDQINEVYRDAYAGVSPDLVAGERVQQHQLAVRVKPSFAITDYAALDLRFDGQLMGFNARATQIFSAALRTAF